MTSRITFSTRRYRHVHGQRPHGFGLWYFQLPGGRVLAIPGSYGEARIAAASHARQIRVDAAVIQVCP